jgi:hypothetical protein
MLCSKRVSLTQLLLLNVAQQQLKSAMCLWIPLPQMSCALPLKMQQGSRRRRARLQRFCAEQVLYHPSFSHELTSKPSASVERKSFVEE